MIYSIMIGNETDALTIKSTFLLGSEISNVCIKQCMPSVNSSHSFDSLLWSHGSRSRTNT